MKSSELDELEESLGIELPDSYRRAIGRLARKKSRGMLAEFVLFFDHDSDELQQCADSIEDFSRRIESGVRLDKRMLHRGYRPDRTKSESASAALPSFQNEPSWMTSWAVFVDAFAQIAARDLTKPATIAKLNCAFGSRAVRWSGTVHSIRLGPHPLITIEMPRSHHSRKANDADQHGLARRAPRLWNVRSYGFALEILRSKASRGITSRLQTGSFAA
jgi:hypothetical protein